VDSPVKIDILTLFHNGRELVDPYLDCVSRLSPLLPFTLHLLDNGSTDGTADLLAARAPMLDFPLRLNRSIKNQGFAGGMNLLAAQALSDFLFLLNSDAYAEADCIEHLVHRAMMDDRIGICEARQAPEEHRKAVDLATGETTWCSGAGALIRRKAFEEVGGFDAKLFFMYCEDIDLSWKMWMKDWKCVYVPKAVVVHHIDRKSHVNAHSRERRPLEHYFSFRNSLFLYHRFRKSGEGHLLWSFLLKRFTSRRYSFGSKGLFAIAFVEHIRYVPYLLRTRRIWEGRRHHPWIRLTETSLAE